MSFKYYKQPDSMDCGPTCLRCEVAEVTATPTLLLDGHRLPDLYQLSDLKYMLE